MEHLSKEQKKWCVRIRAIIGSLEDDNISFKEAVDLLTDETETVLLVIAAEEITKFMEFMEKIIKQDESNRTNDN